MFRKGKVERGTGQTAAPSGEENCQGARQVSAASGHADAVGVFNSRSLTFGFFSVAAKAWGLLPVDGGIHRKSIIPGMPVHMGLTGSRGSLDECHGGILQGLGKRAS